MPSTYIVITRKTLQSLPNSFANPLANWFFHLSSYVRVSYEHIYIYIFVTYFSVCISAGRMKKKKKERRKGGIDRRPRPSRAKITSRFESRSVRVRVALVILTHLRTTPVLLALFCPPLHLRVESSRGESSRVEANRGELSRGEARVGFEVALTAKKIFVNGIEGRSCFCFRPRFVLERNVSRRHRD